MKPWRPTGGDIQVPFMKAGARMMATGESQVCPICNEDMLRFYYREFHAQPERRGTLWIWCERCERWDRLSRISPPATASYHDYFSGLSQKEFGDMEYGDKARWIEHLNQLWNDGRLAQQFGRAIPNSS